MARSASNQADSAGILCDPTNYDWNGHDDHDFAIQDPNTSQDSTTWRPPRNIAAGAPSVQNTPRPAASRATDKDFVDFMSAESTNQTIMHLSNQFAPIAEHDADTLIHFGVPPQVKGQSDYEYGYLCRQFRRPYLLRSDTLLELGSSKFKDLLGPKSKRTQRRLQKAGVHKLILEPDKIKYYVDLSPDIHDEEGMILLTELSAPNGALTWHKNAERFKVSPAHVCGRDSLNLPPKYLHRTNSTDPALREHATDTTREKSNSTKELVGDDPDTADEEQANASPEPNRTTKYDLPLEDDYSQIRHHTAIARLLHAIAGQDPKLNSAPKMWTFCMLAKFFDCIKSNLVNKWVTDWLMQPHNLNFIQVNPSTAFRLGMAIEAEWLVKTSFSVMVGQKAFLDAVIDLKQPRSLYVEPAVHVTDDLDDDDINRVDHAALALSRRVKATLKSIVRTDGEWSNCRGAGTEMERLHQLQCESVLAQTALTEVRSCLQRYVRRLLCTILVETNQLSGSSGRTLIQSQYDVPPPLRPLILPFWEALRKEDFAADHMPSGSLCRETFWLRALNTMKEDGVLAAEDIDIAYVSRASFRHSVHLLNAALCSGPSIETPNASPKKKVKLTPPPIERGALSVFGGDNQAIPQQLVLTEHFDTPSLGPKLPQKIGKAIEYGSDSEWDDDINVHGKHNRGSDDEEWEEVHEYAVVQPTTKPSAQDTIIQELPIRSKPAIVQPPILPVVEESVQVSPTSSKLPVEEDLDLKVLSQAVFDSVTASAPLTQSPRVSSRRSDSRAQSNNLYGNPVSPAPHNTFGVPQDNGRISYHSRAYYGDGDHDLSYIPVAIDTLKAPGPGLFGAQSNDSSPYSKGYIPMPGAFMQAINTSTQNPQPQPGGRQTDQYFTDSERFSNAALAPNDFTAQEWRLRVNSLNGGRGIRPIVPEYLLQEIHNHISQYLKPLVTPGYVTDGSCVYEVPLNEIGTLTSLTEDEYKYLPLWAGGNDDGSGGVFNDGEEIPEALGVEDGGFRGGAMGIIPGVGSSIGGSMAGSEFEEIMTEVGVSTVGRASRIATDGEDTVISMDD